MDSQRKAANANRLTEIARPSLFQPLRFPLTCVFTESGIQNSFESLATRTQTSNAPRTKSDLQLTPSQITRKVNISFEQ